MKRCVLEIMLDGSIYYAKTDSLYSVTTKIENAKRFTLKKASKLLEKPRGYGFKIIEINEFVKAD